MFIRKKFYKIFAFALLFALLLNTTAFAAPSVAVISRQKAVNDAKEYLLNYEDVRTNSQGKEYTVRYSFENEEELTKIAEKIADTSVEAFEKAVKAGVSKSIALNTESQASAPRYVHNSIIEEYISGNGVHPISAGSGGLAEFEKGHTVEYSVFLDYVVTVANGAISAVGNISLSFPYISVAGGVGQTSCSSYANATNAGVTANFVITKRVAIEDDNYGTIHVDYYTDSEVFAVLTYLT